MVIFPPSMGEWYGNQSWLKGFYEESFIRLNSFVTWVVIFMKKTNKDGKEYGNEPMVVCSWWNLMVKVMVELNGERDGEN